MGFNKDVFIENLKFNKNIKKIIECNNIVLKIYIDDIVINIIISQDNIHKFYTTMENPENKYYYFLYKQMPHDSYSSLYKEINRMSDPAKRLTPCEFPYFKN